MPNKKRILLKLTGALLVNPKTKEFGVSQLLPVIKQIKQLRNTHLFGIVIGGGNIFRGSEKSAELGITPSIGHQVGMLATIINGLIIKDLLEQHEIGATHFCALPSPELGKPIIHQEIEAAIEKNNCLIFTAGTGNPFFTTDTNAVLRALQMNAFEIWKGTSVDGVYNKDPRAHKDAHRIAKLTYADALEHELGIMDASAFALAKQYKQRIRIFNIFQTNALLQTAQDPSFGSVITN